MDRSGKEGVEGGMGKKLNLLKAKDLHSKILKI